jgi:hypothetical protein
VRRDGTGLRVITRHGARWPAWSPTGTLAFSNADDQYRMQIDLKPAWSPDGNWIAFRRDGDIYVMRSDGSRVRRIVAAARQAPAHPDRVWTELSGPSWQPLPR